MCTSRSTKVPSHERREQDALYLLGGILRNHGYWDACRLHRNRYIDRRYLVYLKQNKSSFPRATRALIDLFACRSGVSATDLDFVPESVVEGLVDEGVLEPGADGAIRAAYDVHVLESGFLLTEEYRDPVRSVYFGEDSEFYATMLEIAPGSRCLDLCAGTGVQGLVSLARGAAWVDAVDIDPRAVKVGLLNARLNGVADRMRFHQGDMFEALPPDRVYDRITCNPPLLPIPADIPYPRIGDGGPDGLRFTRTVIGTLERRLAQGGKCLLLGLSTSNGVSDVERLCETSCPESSSFSLYVLARQTVDAYAKLVVSTVSQLYPEQNLLRLNRLIRQTYRELGAEHIVSYYLSIHRTGTGAPSGVYDLTRNNHSQNYWFVGAGP